MATFYQIHLPDPGGSRMIIELWNVHCLAITINVFVITTVAGGLAYVISNKKSCRTIYEAPTLEALWTVIPAILLLILAIPSLRLLYAIDEIADPQITVKTIGNQWYWTYEYGDFERFSYDSYITGERDLKPGEPRLLTVDKPCVIPCKEHVRFAVSSTDVIHAFAIPALACKIDALPGRINQFHTYTSPGKYYGICSEICGVNHAFIPIVLEAVQINDFLTWATARRTEHLADLAE